MISIRVPGTIANMGPGFDSLGMAVSLYNQFTFQEAEQDKILLSEEGPDGLNAVSELDRDNVLFQAMDLLYNRVNQLRPRYLIQATAGVPVTRGLGSSSTAVVAGLVAANQNLANPFSTKELLAMAIQLEGHPDNVAPALLGGVVLYDTAAYQLPWSVEWRILTLSPSYPVLTEEARRILPQTVSLKDSIFNMRKTSVLTYALLREDPDALRAGLQDRLHQPHRRKLIKEYDAIEALVMNAGAYGMIISGSGSTMAVFYPTVIHAFLLAQLQDLMTTNQWDIAINDVTVDMDGAQIIA